MNESKQSRPTDTDDFRELLLPEMLKSLHEIGELAKVIKGLAQLECEALEIYSKKRKEEKMPIQDSTKDFEEQPEEE